MTNPKDPFAHYDMILLISYGGPREPDDVLPFMRNATKGRGVPDSRLDAVSVHYYKFDGVSPIVARTEELAATLTNALKAHGSDIPIHIGNRNMYPYVTDVLRDAFDNGMRNILYVPTSAFDSYSGCRQYREDIASAVATLAEEGKTGLKFTRTPPFYAQPGFIKANTLAVLEAVREVSASLWPTFDDEEDGTINGNPVEEPTVIFVTHSIPIPMAEASGLGQANQQDPRFEYEYDRQHFFVYEKIMKEVSAARGKEVPWVHSYCSRSGRPQDPWQEPDIEDVIEELHQQGVRRIVVSPVGFIYDHMEVVYDLDVECTEYAGERGMVFKRARTPGLHPDFIDALRVALTDAALAEDTRADYLSNLNAPGDTPLPAVCEKPE